MTSIEKPNSKTELVPNNVMESRHKSNGQKISSEQTSSLTPTNKLEELDLNDISVEIKGVKFSYNKSSLLLDNFSMTFPRSSIYGFLGPSGCGKTTIIKIITGLLIPLSGTVLVNGKTPRHKDNQIPGPGVGYMSQENCLLEELSIEETLIYFSRIYGLNKEYMNKRIEFILKFLDLPDKSRKVLYLSGGQQRRTSLGVAIIHNPPILILDEPTVGVDPVLREKIWKHLVQLSTEEKTSIMITTHYIDECRNAHVIGLMRNGKLLAENSPNVLLTHFKTQSLEDVFLKLCRANEESLKLEIPPNLDQMRAKAGKPGPKPLKTKSSVNINCRPNPLKRFYALFTKYLIILCSNKSTLFIELFVPMIVMTCLVIFVGKKPFDLEVALFNEERLNTNVDKSKKMSEIFIESIDNKTINLMEYESKGSAIESVKNGKTFGALYFQNNFSIALLERFKTLKSFNASDEVVSQSTIYFFGDFTDLNIFMTISDTLRQSMVKSVIQWMKIVTSNTTDIMNLTDSHRKLNPNAVKNLIETTDPPIYGDNDPIFSEFFLPGILITVEFLMASALTGLNVIEERRKGLLERTVVAGAYIHEILLSMVFVHLFVAVFQAIITIITVYIVFNFKNEGNYLIIISLVVLQVLCGMSLGLLISSLAENTKMVLVVIVGTIVPFLLLSGILWPLEGIEWSFIRSFSLCLPQTMAVKAFRAVTHKGWGLNRLYIWWGYIIPSIWSIIFISVSNVINQFRKD